MVLRHPQISGELALMRTVLLTPLRPTPERLRVWRFVQAWCATNYGMDHVTADSDGKVFSPAQARNRAASSAGQWDVAVFHDADTIVHPDAVTKAINAAATSNQMVVAADSHMYCDRLSSERIMFSGVPMFARPNSFDDRGIYPKPCSGVFAVNRDVWASTGGFIESLHGWGFEDLCFLQCCGLFAGGHTWIDGHISLHLWHPPSPKGDDTATNKAVWQQLTRFRRRNDRDTARLYLASLDHTVP